MSCFTPFISEFMYLNLRNGLGSRSPFKEDSVHFLEIPKFDESLINPNIENAVKRMEKVIQVARLLRDRKNIGIRRPIKSITIVSNDKDF